MSVLLSVNVACAQRSGGMRAVIAEHSYHHARFHGPTARAARRQYAAEANEKRKQMWRKKGSDKANRKRQIDAACARGALKVKRPKSDLAASMLFERLEDEARKNSGAGGWITLERARDLTLRSKNDRSSFAARQKQTNRLLEVLEAAELVLRVHNQVLVFCPGQNEAPEAPNGPVSARRFASEMARRAKLTEGKPKRLSLCKKDTSPGPRRHRHRAASGRFAAVRSDESSADLVEALEAPEESLPQRPTSSAPPETVQVLTDKVGRQPIAPSAASGCSHAWHRWRNRFGGVGEIGRVDACQNEGEGAEGELLLLTEAPDSPARDHSRRLARALVSWPQRLGHAPCRGSPKPRQSD